MLDFLLVSKRTGKKGVIEIYPRFIIKVSKDLMIRGSDFYAIWVEELGLWSTSEIDALAMIDKELDEYAKAHEGVFDQMKVLHMWDSSTGMIDSWHKYCQKQMRDSFHSLDERLIFSNTNITKEMYASKKLPYPLENCPTPAYNELMGTLYTDEERAKLEWAIGAVINGDSKTIQKFIVLYGPPGSGKSTVLNIMQMLFEGYFSVFDASALGSSTNVFALEAFRTNPLVAIQHDGDLSRIEDNTRINSLVSHETMMVNEKYKSTYPTSFKTFLFLGTNKPVRITDAKSGVIRRLIDVEPSGNKIPTKKYINLMESVKFELGGIACHCKEVYESNPRKYDDYIPVRMLSASNDMYNFVLESFYIFKNEDSVTLKVAWEMYKTYCAESGIQHMMPKRVFKEELREYFRSYEERATLENGDRARSYYSGFKVGKFRELKEDINSEEHPEDTWLKFESQHSLLDDMLAECPAQYASEDGTPTKKWCNVKSKLKDIDSSKLHYVKCPEQHIFIDFDIPGKDGGKNFEANLKAASKWPKTYAELSKSGSGIHLHYIYSGDVLQLSRIYEEHIEVKVCTGNSSIRRMLTKCNDIPVATISSGLPLKVKGEAAMKQIKEIKSEKALRAMIVRNLNKEYHAYTKPSIDFIWQILEDAYESDLVYNVSDMRNAILGFAVGSTNNADYCVKKVGTMKFKSKEKEIELDEDGNAPIVFFDCEVFPNLLLVCWKIAGKENKVVKMFNPSPSDIEELIRYRLIGFNNRDYDNHIIYACMIGWSPFEIYNLSQQLIQKHTGFFGEAYRLSYTDIFDFSKEKKGLKKFEIELGIHHQELGLPWDKPVPEELWEKVGEYCENDVLATEAVFYSKKGQADFLARKILADISGLSLNDKTNSHTTKIIFGNEKHPQLIYTDLATGVSSDGTYNPRNKFEGYMYRRLDQEGEKDDGRMHNMFRGVDLGRGGYVYAEKNMYTNVALLDVASMHPNSVVQLNMFGEFTQNFQDLLNARLYIKHKEYDKAKQLFGGRLAKYLDDPKQAKDLAAALKIAINSVYGLTSAGYDNPFRDRRNINNIVALRGALFMKTLQDEVVKRGFTVAHIKTDSIKIPEATPEIIKFCQDLALEYGYVLEHEATYAKMCLVNDAVYIAKYATKEWCEEHYGYIPGDIYEHSGEWTATGKQFQVPYVFKSLFSKEPIAFYDMCEVNTVKKGAIYIDANEGLADGEHNYIFVGRVGQFTPVSNGFGGGDLVCIDGENPDGTPKVSSVQGAKGYLWLESEVVRSLYPDDPSSVVDKGYYNHLVDEAIDAISKYCDFEWFVSDDIGIAPWDSPGPPWDADSDTKVLTAC